MIHLIDLILLIWDMYLVIFNLNFQIDNPFFVLLELSLSSLTTSCWRVKVAPWDSIKSLVLTINKWPQSRMIIKQFLPVVARILFWSIFIQAKYTPIFEQYWVCLWIYSNYTIPRISEQKSWNPKGQNLKPQKSRFFTSPTLKITDLHETLAELQKFKFAFFRMATVTVTPKLFF